MLRLILVFVTGITSLWFENESFGIYQQALAESKFNDQDHIEYQRTLEQQISDRFKSLKEKNAEKLKAHAVSNGTFKSD